MGRADTLQIVGEQNLSKYRSEKNDRDNYEVDGFSKARRYFCSKCGSALWINSMDYPDFVYPFASAIDTPLPEPPEMTHLMLEHKASWVPLQVKEYDTVFEKYPNIGIEDWHRKRGLFGNI
tara:strand:- start:7884 stop:8246 length:363 start_codon:yes stop_codon:yes gene_type:complete